MAVKLPNPKYVPNPYEQMKYPGQRVQIDVKFVPQVCIVVSNLSMISKLSLPFVNELTTIFPSVP